MYMLCGPSCVGKTTFRKEWLSQHLVVDTDSRIEMMAEADGQTYNECFGKYFHAAEKAMNHNIDCLIASGQSFVWDQTNLTSKTRLRKMSRIPAHKYIRVGVFFVGFTNDVLMVRNKRPGKIIPEDAILRMIADYEVKWDDCFDEVIYKWVDKDSMNVWW
jgi:tRNA uridine 5-carbamoylmethylation protein Kti12